MATKKELRLTFTDKDLDLIEYLSEKTSKVAWIKDTLRKEMKHEKAYINFNGVNLQPINGSSETLIQQTKNISIDNDCIFNIDDLF